MAVIEVSWDEVDTLETGETNVQGITYRLQARREDIADNYSTIASAISTLLRDHTNLSHGEEWRYRLRAEHNTYGDGDYLESSPLLINRAPIIRVNNSSSVSSITLNVDAGETTYSNSTITAFDPDGDNLIFSGAPNDWTFDANGLRYDGDAFAVGLDTDFVLQVTDPYGATDTLNVTVTVNIGSNTAPNWTSHFDGSIPNAQGSRVIIDLDPLVHDDDHDSQLVFSYNGPQGINTGLTFSLNQTNQTLTITRSSEEDNVGTRYSFEVTATDLGSPPLSATRTFYITISSTPGNPSRSTDISTRVKSY